MDDLPSIVVVSSSNTKPKSIIKLITRESPVEKSGVFVQPWEIDTKYYSATVNLIGIQESYNRNEDFNNQVEALIVHMDSNKLTGLEDLKPWEKLENDCDPEIKLLIANYCNDETKIKKQDATTWCLKRGYEFIELYPSDMQNIQNSEEDIIPEKFGVNRVIEALQAHTWSNLIMKNQNTTKQKKAECSEEARNEATTDVSNNSKLVNLPEELLGEDDFTELFSHLHMMKDSLQSLPMQQRKQCAEQMVTAFWKAIGGDEEELLDL